MTQPLWPVDEVHALESRFGRHEFGMDGQVSERWERANLTTIDIPWVMWLAWDKKVAIYKIRCNRQVSSSLGSILQKINRLFKNDITKLGLDMYGGCYNYRMIRNRNRLSVHAWGAAIDLNPGANQLGTKGNMSPGVVEIFEDAGWTWGGQWKRSDPMHFQATQ